MDNEDVIYELPQSVCADRPIIGAHRPRRHTQHAYAAEQREGGGVRVIPPEGAYPSCLAITPDDNWLALGSWPNSIKIYRTNDGRLVRTVGLQYWGDENELGFRLEKGDKSFRGTVNNAWSLFEHERDADEDIEAHWWECDEGECVEPKAKKHHHKGEIFNIAVSDSRIVTVGTVWNGGPDRMGCPILGGPSLGQGHRAIGPSPGQTKLWDLHSGAWLRDLGRQASAIAISNDQSRAAIALTPDVKIVALSNGDCLRKVKADGWVYSVALSLDNAFLFMHSNQG